MVGLEDVNGKTVFKIVVESKIKFVYVCLRVCGRVYVCSREKEGVKTIEPLKISLFTRWFAKKKKKKEEWCESYILIKI